MLAHFWFVARRRRLVFCSLSCFLILLADCRCAVRPVRVDARHGTRPARGTTFNQTPAPPVQGETEPPCPSHNGTSPFGLFVKDKHMAPAQHEAWPFTQLLRRLIKIKASPPSRVTIRMPPSGERLSRHGAGAARGVAVHQPHALPVQGVCRLHRQSNAQDGFKRR